MGEILGSLRISHERAIGGLTLAADQGHVPGGGHEVGVVGAAAVDLEVSQKVAPDPGLGAKVDLVLDQKAGNLDQRANLSPSLIGDPVRALGADLKSMRNLGAGLVPDRVPPKKMVKVISNPNLDRGAIHIHPYLFLPQRLVLCPRHQKELQDPILGLVPSQGHGPDRVPEINPELLCSLHTIMEHFPTCLGSYSSIFVLRLLFRRTLLERGTQKFDLWPNLLRKKKR